MTITGDNLEDLVTVVAGLTKNGIMYNASVTTTGWLVKMTGGF